MIHIPIKGDKKKLDLAEEYYWDTMGKITYSNRIFIMNSIDDNIGMLTGSPIPWKAELGRYAETLFFFYRRNFNEWKYLNTECFGNLNIENNKCLECGEDNGNSLRHKECAKMSKMLKTYIYYKPREIILSALFYLCLIEDVIPDYIPGEGFLDDVHVMNLCLKEFGHFGKIY